MKNVALIGSGYWGKNLVRNFNEPGALHTICDKNVETLKWFQDQFPETKCRMSFEMVLQDPAVDVVVIATPAETYSDMAKRALLVGKYVFVEKPSAFK